MSMTGNASMTMCRALLMYCLMDLSAIQPLSCTRAGGVPEVMLHLRNLGLLDTSVLTATGQSLDDNLDWWEDSERRRDMRDYLRNVDGVNPDDVIMSADRAKSKGLTSTVTFPRGNLAPHGSVIKSTAIDPTVVDDDGVYRNTGKARVFVSEREAIRAIKTRDESFKIKAGDIMVVNCGGPLGTGMEELYQITAALKHLSYGKHVALITDARFSGVSTGACIGHVGPEALAGGPIGKSTRRRPRRDHHRPQQSHRFYKSSRRRRCLSRCRLGSPGVRSTPNTRQPRAASAVARRLSTLGSVTSRIRRNLGRLRL